MGSTITLNNVEKVNSIGDHNVVIDGADKSDLEKLLRQALEQVDNDSDVGKALASMQTEVTTKGEVSNDKASFLKTAVEALPQAEQAVGILNKVVGTLVKAGVLPS